MSIDAKVVHNTLIKIINNAYALLIIHLELLKYPNRLNNKETQTKHTINNQKMSL